jgi:hypothetical protein
MATITIPDSNVDGLRLFFDLDEEKFKVIMNSVDQLPNLIQPYEITLKFVELSGNELSLTAGSLILSTAVAMITQLLRLGRLHDEEFKKGVAEYLVKEYIERHRDEGDLSQKIEKVTNYLVELASSPQLQNILKAREALLWNENTFTSVEINADIRPVFDGEEQSKIIGNVIIHDLRIIYKQGIEKRVNREIVLAFDEGDLDIMINALNQAKKEGSTIKEMLNKTAIPIYSSGILGE